MSAFAVRTIKGYELRERLGAGSFGVVYRAYQSTVRREVAIKIIQPQYANQPEFVRQFEVEAQLVARLEHPHIVPLFDYWRDPSGAYLVMRWLPHSLRSVIARNVWSPVDTARLLDQLSAALTIAHRDNVIHRDIKPDNILLDEDGNGYLADFSIAKDLSLRGEDSALLEHPAYLSPEQINDDAVTARTDIYSLGFVIYELLTGEKAFPDAVTPDDYLKYHLNERLPLLSDRDMQLPAALDEVLQTATAKDPARRYGSVARFAAAFRAALPVAAPRAPQQPLADPLTERELDVLGLIVDGNDNQQIAQKLVLSPTTVKWYVRQIYGKLDAHSRQQAIERAQRLRLVKNETVTPAASTNHTGDVPMRGASKPLADPVNPYKGLRAFQEADAADFFGRATLVEELLNRLSDGGDGSRFLVVVGPSGSGKSSVVRAGLIPALRNGGLAALPRPFIAEMMPGTHPLEELEAALLRVSVNPLPGLLDQLREDRRGLVRAAKRILPTDPDTELVLVVDQLEEIFTLVQDAATRVHFLDNLLSAASDPRGRVRIILVLRADFYDRPLLHPRFGELVSSHSAVVLPLSARDTEQAIIAPAERVGVRLEAGLLATILKDVSEQPGALPLLQYALTELFEQREGVTLTLDAYQAMGGVYGALARRADELYESMDMAAQVLARQVFLRLVTLGEGTEDTRRRALLDELASLGDEGTIDDVIDAFAAYRLLTLDHDPLTHSPTVEIAHEALIREWGLLSGWLSDSREDVRLQRSLARAAGEWEAAGDASFLATGVRLAQYESWAAATDLVLTAQERAYLDASVSEREDRTKLMQEREAQQRALEQRARRFLVVLVGVFAAAAAIALVLSIIAFNLNRQAQRSADQFRSTALANGAREELLEGHPDVALALAQESVNMVDPPAQSELMFFEAASSSWIKQRYTGGHTSNVIDAVFFPDGQRMVTTGFDGRAVIWDVATGEQLQSNQIGGRLVRAAVHPSGNRVAVASLDGELVVWNLDTDTTATLELGETQGRGVVFNLDGSLLVGTTEDGNIFVWDVATLERIRAFGSINAAFSSPSLSADETLLVAGSTDGAARIWDFQTGELLQTLEHPSPEGVTAAQWISTALFLPDGERIITSDSTSSIRLWNWRSGEVIWHLVAPNDSRDLALSPDGSMFVTGAEPDIPDAHLWDTETGTLLRAYKGHTDLIDGVDFSADGEMFLSASHDRTAILWPVQWEGTISTFDLPGARWVVPHPSKPLIAVAYQQPDSSAHSILLIDTETNAIVRRLEGNREGIQSMAFSPDGRLLLSGDAATSHRLDDQDVYVWDVESGERVAVLEDHYGWVQSIAFSPNGRTVAIGEAIGARIILWDMETFTRVGMLEGHQTWVTGLAYSPDERFLYSSSRDGALFQWDVASGGVIHTFAGHNAAIYGFDLSDDGTRLFTAAADGTAHAWDTVTGELLISLVGHESGIWWLDYDPNRDAVVTSSFDGTFILWDAATGERLRRYVNSQTDALFYVPASFSIDGRTLLSGFNDQLIIWDATPLSDGIDAWVRQNRYVASLTCEQRALYQIEPLCEQMM